MSKNLKLKKVIESVVPEPKESRQSFSRVFGFLFAYEHCERLPYPYEYVCFTYSYLGRIFVYITQGYLPESERNSVTGVRTRLRRFHSPSL